MIEHTMDGLSMNIEQTNLDKLRSVFPECFSEGKLDIDKLLSLCGEYIDNDFEKYKFEWKGKADCLRLAQKRSTGTLRPCPEESVDWDTTQNLYIEGDNLEVLKLLQTAYYPESSARGQALGRWSCRPRGNGCGRFSAFPPQRFRPEKVCRWKDESDPTPGENPPPVLPASSAPQCC